MSLILLIDTSEAPSSVGIASDGKLLAAIRQNDEKFALHSAIQQLLKENDIDWQELHAVAVTEGPGSYTGLRVGMAAAKGLCYPLKLPLITIGTLHAIAQTGIEMIPDAQWVCPMMDARRQEVFTAIFDRELQEIMAPQPMVLSEDSFSTYLEQGKQIAFLGSGAAKWAQISSNNLTVNSLNISILKAMSLLAQEKMDKKTFADLFYATPSYLKDFYTPGR